MSKDAKEEMRLTVDIGYGNILLTNRILAIYNYRNTSRLSRSIYRSADEAGKLLDATQGRKAKSLVILNEGFVAASRYEPFTIVGRMLGVDVPSEGETISDL
jgi:regulator of extracellular matrix RemA (YlzA/DUF370 family)